MMAKVELFYEPVEILNQLSDEYTAEMSEKQSAFLCGLLKKYRPQKLVEIGVAAGGTTSVILNCISMLNLETEMVSIDLNTDFYRDKSKKTGYLAEECKKILGKQFNHTLYTGKYAVEYLKEIGKDIDFLILDTVHSLPGEFLDFLAFYPFLKQGAVVVLHDIALNYCHINPDGFATKLLLDTVVAEKFIEKDEDGNLLNIGAFMITGDTGRYIGNVFSALTISWKYMPGREELLLYREIYKEHFSSENLELFDMAVSMNQKILDKRKHINQEEFIKIYTLIERLKRKEGVYIYGCGYFGKRIKTLFERCGIRFKGYLISDGQNRDKNDKMVFYLSDVDFDETKDTIFIGVNYSIQAEVLAKLSERGIKDYILPENYIYKYLD